MSPTPPHGDRTTPIQDGEALTRYQQALADDPLDFEALQGIAILHAQRGRLEEALRFITTACEIQPQQAATQFNRGKILQQLQRPEDALACYDLAISLKPDFAEAYNNRGNVLKSLGHYVEALASYDRAIAFRTNYMNAHSNRGAVLILLCRFDEALADYDKILSLNPNFANAYNNRGIILGRLKRYQEALADYDKAIALDPSLPYIPGERLHLQMRICLWEDLEKRITALCHAVEQGLPASQPFPLFAVPTTPALLQKCAMLYSADKLPPEPRPLWNGDDYGHRRLRLGYFSADFYQHATAHLAAGLFEEHDRDRFEVFAFSFAPVRSDGMQARLVKGFDHFLDVTNHGDQDIAALARRHEIDIAIDLNGYTQDCRPSILARRPAPIQVNYLGFPGTMGAPHMDYILADPVVIPRKDFGFYSEKVVHLPHSYQVNDSKRRIADTAPSRDELGLPDNGFVFCCFNNHFKITPDAFTLWMQLLSKVENSVLWLLEGGDDLRRNLGREARQRGIAPERLVFAPYLPAAEHLARHRQADLFLDTFYYNAHTTASDALWAGLPVVTCPGNTFAGRVAASLLQAIGLPELIASSHEEYAALALRLATRPAELAVIKQKLAARRRTEPLFDTTLFTRHLESAYIAMWQRHQQGLAPDHIYIGH